MEARSGKIGFPHPSRMGFEKILSRRAKYYPNHPKATPKTLLGKASLESIAERIVTTGETARAKKEVYHGIQALAGVCVGDIGDVISIYELILKKAAGSNVPIPPDIQSGCYQDFCSRRLFDLNRRENTLKDVALSFAEASHELLMQSHSASKRGKPPRLRQYTKVYVRITTGDPEQQFERLRVLIDSGVFILAGGSDTPRTKTRDSNPIQQFVLTFRKLFGLSNFIGLAARDRFELSGPELEEWLVSPDRGKEILMRNLQSTEGEESTDDEESDEDIEEDMGESDTHQRMLFDTVEVIGEVFTNGTTPVDSKRESYVESKVPRSSILSTQELTDRDISEIVVGLGFEERCLESAKRLVKLIRPQRAQLIQYPEKGNSEEIQRLVRSVCGNVVIVDYKEVLAGGMPVSEGNVLVDVSGLAKPAIFQAVRSVLKRNRRVWWSDTRASQYYPLDEDISKVLEADRNRDHYTLLTELSKLISGESGRFEVESLLSSNADESRRRVLCAFSSSRHDRLLTLLDERDYDRVEILVPPGETPRTELAQIAAEVAVQNYPGSVITRIDPHDLNGVLRFVTERFQRYYVDGGFNFEVALTGSKLQAVASAALAAAFKVSQCWYVHAQQFEVDKFTRGTGSTTYYEISIDDDRQTR